MAWNMLDCVEENNIPEPPPQAPTLSMLALVIKDSGQRARSLREGNGPASVDPVLDLVRLLNDVLDLPQEHLRVVAERAQVALAQLARLRLAYRYGGLVGSQVAAYPAEAPSQRLHQAAEMINTLEITPRPDLKVHQNRITDLANGIEIRLGPDDRWYPFTIQQQEWAPAPEHSQDAVAAYQAARVRRSMRR
ncbi:hypothetical protein HII36_49350 [Nonomuraea sp. NN258]|uniref:hypothetical protein n=1 Tax=Nonomuraea antri TaxID=2730852 RepID=UPI00156992DB|nr:hypothetical protein [Nonomuraea antri]NRQ39787.1 hypothetical protein [Nonomuraea antri]